MAAATVAGAAAISLFTYYLFLRKSGSKLPWTLTTRRNGQRTRRKGLVEAIGNTPLVRINSLSDATGCEVHAWGYLFV
jgi:cysteine synthase A